MKCRFVFTIAAAAAISAICTQAALAGPMDCSGELKTCVSRCMKILNRTAAATCATACQASRTTCTHTGCWNNGTNSYCGLLRK